MKRAIGIFNGNWKNQWRDMMNEPQTNRKETANDWLVKLMDLVGDEKAREMTNDLTGSWQEISDAIKALVETRTENAQKIRLPKASRYIISQDFIKRHLNSPADLKHLPGKVEVKS